MELGDLVEAVLEERDGVLGAGEPDDDGEDEEFGEAFEDEVPAAGRGEGVDGLVDLEISQRC